MTLNVNDKGRFGNLRVRLSLAWLTGRKRLWHNLLRLTGKQPRTIFLVGSGRSGTDILAHCLSQSLAVKLINEDNPLGFENWRLKDLDYVKQVVMSSGAPIVLLKPIVETMRVQEFLEVFPGSRAIFTIRDYRDAINSMVRFFGPSHVRAVNSWVESDFARFPLVPGELRQLVRQIWRADSSMESACGIYWLVYNSSCLFLDLQMDSRVYIMNYESLVMDSENTLRRVCTFAGVTYKSKMVSDVYATSIQRDAAPHLSPVLRHHCEKTWRCLDSICQHSRRQ